MRAGTPASEAGVVRNCCPEATGGKKKEFQIKHKPYTNEPPQGTKQRAAF